MVSVFRMQEVKINDAENSSYQGESHDDNNRCSGSNQSDLKPVLKPGWCGC
jgi:hypothetical protein